VDPGDPGSEICHRKIKMTYHKKILRKLHFSERWIAHWLIWEPVNLSLRPYVAK
jgi:hypothetical protein